MDISNSKYFDLWAKEYTDLPDERSFHLNYTGKLITKKYNLNINKKGLDVVDLGIGNGRFLSALNCTFSRMVGIDSSKEQLALARKNLQEKNKYLEVIQCDLEKAILLKDQSMDLVISNATVHHIKNKTRLFQEVYRTLRPKGAFVFFDFYFEDTNREMLKNTLSKQAKSPLISRKFISSIKKEYDLMPEHLEKNHPHEYHESPGSLVKSLESIGFKNCEIIPTFYSKYLGVGCIK